MSASRSASIVLLIALAFFVAGAPPVAWSAGAGSPQDYIPNIPAAPSDQQVFSALNHTPTAHGEPPDVIADQVWGQPDLHTNIDSGPTRSGIGYPMGSAYFIRGDTHYLFVVDEGYNRVMVFDRANSPVNGRDAAFVIGQPDFTSGEPNAGNFDSPTASSFFDPTDLCIDKDGNLFVADYVNSRVLIFRDPIGTDLVADSVIGQGGDFTTRLPNKNGLSAASLMGPLSVAVDDAGNLFVADGANHRVLVYYDALNTDLVADTVIGQPNFTSNKPNKGGPSRSTLFSPYRVRLDHSGNLYMTDFLNSRGLVFNNPLTEDLLADKVIGQPGFNTGNPNYGGRSASSIRYPCSLGVDEHANLYMADWGNNRVLFYRRPLAEDAQADILFGQVSWSTASGTQPVSGASLWGAQRIDFDPYGNVFVSDCYNSRVLKYTMAEPKNVCPIPWLTVPRTGQAVSGNAVSIIAHMANAHDVTIQFQWRRDAETNWQNLGDPVPKRPYLLKWNTTVLPEETIWLRAQASEPDCDTTYSLPVRVTIDRSHPHVVENVHGKDGEKETEKTVKVESGKKTEIDVDGKSKLTFTSKSLKKNSVLVVTDFETNPVTEVPNEIPYAEGISFHDFTLTSGSTTLSDSVSIEFTYPDEDNNGVIDGTEIPEASVGVFYFNEALKDWEKLTDVTVNTAANTVLARVNHFSSFGLFGQGTAPPPPAASGGSSASSAPSSGGGCVISRVAPAAAWLGWLRACRDVLLESGLGRLLVGLYYSL